VVPPAPVRFSVPKVFEVLIVDVPPKVALVIVLEPVMLPDNVPGIINVPIVFAPRNNEQFPANVTVLAIYGP
jgi:hypothetical protein